MTTDHRTQQTIEAASGDEPTIGVPLSRDDRTHYAHTRYAAAETPGVRFFDPRDGREHYAIGDVPNDTDVGFDDRVLTSIHLYPHRSVCQIIDGDERFVVEYQYKTREVFEKPPGVDDVEYVTAYGGSDVYDDVQTAREAAAELCEGYASAEFTNAVEHRLGGGSV